MPSYALLGWRTDRLPRLDVVETHVAAVAADPAADPRLADEFLRGFVVLLSAHFQGFCRDLHSECSVLLAKNLAAPTNEIVRESLTRGRELDRTNARYESVKADFERFQVDLTATLRSDPTHGPTVDADTTQLNLLNAWRNHAAHQTTQPPSHGGPLAPVALAVWKGACDRFAAALDAAMYNRLVAVLRVPPW